MNSWSLKKEILLHVLIVAVFFTPFVIIHQIYSVPITFLVFILGIVLGTFLPDIDHLIYSLFLKPKEITSQRLYSKLQMKNFASAINLLFSTRDERKTLVFHTVFFQCLFLVFAFLVVSSTSSLFGRALTVSFLLSLCVDQLVDIKYKADISRWIRGISPTALTSQQINMYVLVQIFLVIVIGYLF